MMWGACVEEPDGFAELSLALGTCLSYLPFIWGPSNTNNFFFPLPCNKSYNSCSFTECLWCLDSHISVCTCADHGGIVETPQAPIRSPYPLAFQEEVKQTQYANSEYLPYAVWVWDNLLVKIAFKYSQICFLGCFRKGYRHSSAGHLYSSDCVPWSGWRSGGVF